jgi:hypothetical protein
MWLISGYNSKDIHIELSCSAYAIKKRHGFAPEGDRSPSTVNRLTFGGRIYYRWGYHSPPVVVQSPFDLREHLVEFLPTKKKRKLMHQPGMEPQLAVIT